MASRSWFQSIFGPPQSASARPRRERDDWYIPLEIGRLEERRVLNVAPVLAGANNVTTVHQNQPVATNTGTKVADLVSGHITDPDPGALSGIAVTAANNTNGKWQFSTDGGGNWSDFGSPSNSNARLLAADASTYVRFLPNTDFNGTATLTFRAWDQTNGSNNGDTASTSSNGGTTAFSTATANSSVTVDKPLTVTGTMSKSINDNQTTSPFSGVTIGDSLDATESLTVTVSLDVAANGTFSTLGGFVDNGNGSYTFTGTAAAATTAIQGLVFNPTAHQVAPGSTVDTTLTILVADAVSSTTDSSSVVHATATNTAPTLTGANNLTSILPNNNSSSGTLVSDLIAGHASDPDFGQTLGIAITAIDETHGNWQYTTDAGAHWHDVPNSVANNKALLLVGDADTRVRFQPTAGFSGLVADGITFRAWDGFTGNPATTVNTTTNGGSTAFSSATASSSIYVNNAPTLTGANDLPTINENDVTSAGALVSALIAGKASDANSDPLGIAITNADNTNGTWQYSTDSGSNWTNIGSPTAGAALLLAGDATTKVRFVPAADYFGTASITFQAWDETSGTATGTGDASTSGGATAFSAANASSTIRVNAPPTITGTVAGQTTNDATPISPFAAATINDPDTPAQTLTVTVELSDSANGQFTAGSFSGWSTVTPGKKYSITGTAAATTTAIRALVFQPTPHQVAPGQTVTTTFTVNANDQIAPVASDSTTTVIATATNTAPTLAGANNLTAIQQNPVVNNGDLVSALIAGQVIDPDSGQTEGIAITAVDNSHGTWQYSTDGGSNWTDIGPVDGSNSLLLAGDAQTRVRFVPSGSFSGTISNGLTFRAWDGFSGNATTKVDTTTNGGSTAFSAATASSSVIINDAPTLAGANNLGTILENPPTNPGTLVSALIAGQVNDVNGNSIGIAVTAVDNSHGTWQYSTDSGSNWTAFGSPDDAHARLLAADANTLVRFVPANNYFGSSSITFRAWDQTTGTVTQIGDTTTNGGTTAFSAASASSSITVEAPPTITGTATKSIGDNVTTTPFDGVTIADPDTASVTVTITQIDPANGTLSNLGGFVDNGNGSFSFTGTPAAATTAIRAIVFTPTANQATVGTVVDSHFTISVSDGFTSTTDTSTLVHVTSINDAPSLNGAQVQPFTTITEDDVNNPGESVASLLNGAESDVDFGPLQGIAITATSTSGGTGRWQFSTDGGSSWTDIGAVSDSSALLLRSTDLVRFLPDAKNGNTGSITFRGWDQTGATAGQQGTKADASTNGGAAPFSTTTGTSNITVTDVNDAPVIAPSQVQNFTTITEDDTNNPGNSVASLLGTADTDVDNGAVFGIAITATTVSGNGAGKWQFSTDGGASWTDIGAVSDSSALVLRSTDFVRFLPDSLNGNTGSITFRGWDQTGATAGQQGTTTDTTTNGGTTPFSSVKGTSNITVQDVNDAPVLVPGQIQQFTNITEDDVNNSGDSVASLLGTSVSDVDFGAVQGIAITATSTSGNGAGKWQFSTDGGSSWNDIGAVSDSSALLLRSTDRVRFLPDGNNGNTGSITYRAWDQSGATAGQQGTKKDASTNGGTTPYSTATATSSIVVQDLNDAPVLVPGQVQNFTTITEDDINNSGNTVASLLGSSVTDVDTGSIQGIAITATSIGGSGTGRWQFSIDGGANWSDIGAVSDGSALLLRSSDLVRFLPDGLNGNTGSVTFRAWDQTGGTAAQQGTKADTSTNGGTSPYSTAKGTSNITVQDVNDAPVLDPTQVHNFTTITEDNTSNTGDTVASLLGSAVSDVDTGAVQGIAITATSVSGNGTGKWQFSTDGGSSWIDIGAVSSSSALLLRSTDRVRFLPDGNNGNTGSITYRAWDQSSVTAGQQGTKQDASTAGGTTPYSTATATSNIIVQDVNDAPVLVPGQIQNFTSITEDDIANGGNTVASLLGSAVADVDTGAIQGIAITATSVSGNGLGRWQYSIDGGANWVDIGVVSDSSALILRPTDLVRFLPDAKNGNTGSITFRAWDQTGGTLGQQGTKIDTTANGGTTPYSTAKGTSTISVADVNDAPVLDSTQVQNFTTITEDDIVNSGNTVASLLGTSVSDVDFGAVLGIAITATTVAGNGAGKWQFSTDGGLTWIDVGAVSNSSALLLRSTDRVRLLPDANNGNTGSITFRAWDQTGATSGQQGTKTNSSPNGGTTPFSTATATSNITALDVNDAPVLVPVQVHDFTTITEDDISNPGNSVASLLAASTSDVDFGAVQGIAITATSIGGSGTGRWQFSTDGGTTWNDIGAVSDGSALLLRSSDFVRFLPDAKNGNIGSISFRAWDQTGATAGQQGTKTNTSPNGGTTPFSLLKGTSNITVQDVNDAPVLVPGQVQNFTTITEDDVNNNGNTVASLLATADSDVDTGAVRGIAITATSVAGHGTGRWQYSTDNGASWNDIGAVTESSALLLRSTDRVRFLPDAMNGNTGSVTFRAWDQTSLTTGQQGTKVDVSTNGGITPFSSAHGTSLITVSDVNDAPVLASGQVHAFITISEDDVNNNGNTVASLLGSSVSDVDFGALQGISITSISVTGTRTGTAVWQFNLNDGTGWHDVGAVSDASALLLRPTDLVRIRPDSKNGNSFKITYRAWDQSDPADVAGTKDDTTVNGGIASYSTAEADSPILVQDANDAPVIDPQAIFLPASGPGSVGAIDGSPVSNPWVYTEVDSPLLTPPFTWGISSGNNGAFTIDPATGAVSVASAALFGYSGSPMALAIGATQNEFNATSAPATGTQNLTIIPWMVTTSATQINNLQQTTLTINLVSAVTHSFTAEITWGDETGPQRQMVTFMANTPTQVNHTYAANPNKGNAAQPIPITIDVAPDGQVSPVHATADTVATVPGNVFAAVKVTEGGGSSFVDLPRVEILELPAQTTAPLAAAAQTTAAGAAGGEATNTDERVIALRLVSPSEENPRDLVLASDKDLKLLIGDKRAFTMSDTDLNDLPGLFKKLPDGRYQIWLAEEGHLRLVIDVVVRQGRAVDPNDNSSVRDRPPTGETEVGHRDPIAEIKAEFQKAINSRKTDVPDVQPIDSTFTPDRPEWFIAPVGQAQSTAAGRNGHAPERNGRPGDGRAPGKETSADSDEKKQWGAAVAAGAAVVVGAHAVRSREDRIDEAMEQLDPRSLSKVARLKRWLRRFNER